MLRLWHVNRRPGKKMAPLLGPDFKRLRFGGMSGKAMQGSAPAAGTVRVVMRRINEGEGHVAGFAASLLPLTEAFAAPNLAVRAIAREGPPK
jgi:hypothetical protein